MSVHFLRHKGRIWAKRKSGKWHLIDFIEGITIHFVCGYSVEPDIERAGNICFSQICNIDQGEVCKLCRDILTRNF